ncbi:TIP41-like protein [Anopheles albimanus]|uniref:TIP41-like protein n=1 Tax=Anopheles albimanus TaxID=7167 RepID=UPI0016404407|nr:TIP41-like protein [Anopheles albimanus]
MATFTGTAAPQPPPQVTGGDGLGPVRLPVDSETHQFDEWTISYTKSHILKSVCVNDNRCVAGDAGCCELCVYNFQLELPHLPDMVFHRNVLRLCHSSGAVLEFRPIDALKRVRNEKPELKVACSDEWRESRPEASQALEKVKDFDWSFTTDYSGTVNERLRVEPTEQRIDMLKLKRREPILFYHDLTLFEDELHDHGISLLSVKVRVMPSGFYILQRFFLRVDGVLIRVHETRFHYEKGNDYLLKEFTHREARVEQLKQVHPALFTDPNEIVQHLPVVRQVNEKVTIVSATT